MIPMEEVWTDRFHRLRGVRNAPNPLTKTVTLQD